MKKIVLNKCFGGYGLSKEAYEFLGLKWDDFGYAYDDDRENPRLVECIETLGEKANGSCAELCIEEYDDYNYRAHIGEYDGLESLVLTPVVHKNLIKCMDYNQIFEYLTSLNIELVDQNPLAIKPYSIMKQINYLYLRKDGKTMSKMKEMKQKVGNFVEEHKVDIAYFTGVAVTLTGVFIGCKVYVGIHKGHALVTNKDLAKLLLDSSDVYKDSGAFMFLGETPLKTTELGKLGEQMVEVGANAGNTFTHFVAIGEPNK